MSPVTSWRHRVGEILTLCAFALLWAPVAGWLASPWWGWLRAAVIVGGVALAAVAYERGKRLGRRSPEQPEEAAAESPPQHFAWYERTGVAWWALVVSFWMAMEAGPFWSDLALNLALIPVVVWWERCWRRARLRSTRGANGPAYWASSAASIAWGREIAQLLPPAWLALIALCFLGVMIWVFTWCWGFRRGRREASIACLGVA